MCFDYIGGLDYGSPAIAARDERMGRVAVEAVGRKDDSNPPISSQSEFGAPAGNVMCELGTRAALGRSCGCANRR